MKTKFLFAAAMIIISSTIFIYGQTTHKAKKNTVIKKYNISREMGKPVFESTIDSLNTKVWILTQKKQRAIMNTYRGKMMSKMKSDSTIINKTIKEIILSGTHCIILDVTNISNGKEVADTSAKVEVVSPSKKISSVNFIPMMSYFGGGVTLDEKGDYLFTINLNVGAGYKTTQFKYKLR